MPYVPQFFDLLSSARSDTRVSSVARNYLTSRVVELICNVFVDNRGAKIKDEYYNTMAALLNDDQYPNKLRPLRFFQTAYRLSQQDCKDVAFLLTNPAYGLIEVRDDLCDKTFQARVIELLAECASDESLWVAYKNDNTGNTSNVDTSLAKRLFHLPK